MKALTRGLLLENGGVVALVGCGGKTSLIQRLAEENKERKVLITPTTHMYPMEGAVGVYHSDTGKLSSLPADALARMVPVYDLSLLEADGSRGLPLKGWRKDEPVVPDYCTHTVGVVSLAVLDMPVSDANCLRLPEFFALTDARVGDIVTLDLLERMICAPEGMFRNGAGKQCLVINQVENPHQEIQARNLAEKIRGAFPGRFAAILYGNAHLNRWKTA